MTRPGRSSNTRSKGLSLRPQEGSGSPAKVSGKKYVFPANDRKLEAITLESDGKDGAVTLVTRCDGVEQRIACGRGAWQKGRVAWGPLPQQPAAASGAWTADGTFTAKLCFYETPFIVTVSLKFSGKELQLQFRGERRFRPDQGIATGGEGRVIALKTYRIALYPGDGIGPEVVDAALDVVEAAQRVVGGFHLDCTRFDWGMAHYDRHGRVAPEDFLATLRGFDAIFLGAVGWPARLPDSVTLAPLIQLRQAFGLYANVRPAQTFRGVPGPLRSERPIDLVVVRENSEGEYVDNGGTLAAGTPDEVAIQSAVHTRRGIERILRFAFHLARHAQPRGWP